MITMNAEQYRRMSEIAAFAIHSGADVKYVACGELQINLPPEEKAGNETHFVQSF